MKISIVLTAVAAIASKVSAACFSEKLGFPCCDGEIVVLTDSDGKWGVENNHWCGMPDGKGDTSCWSHKLNYPCCKNTQQVVETDQDGKWGIENNEWCGI
ncbi:Non-catalytic module family DOC2, partial [Piromyces sp. E2]